ncbi:ATP-dependent RNA helicase Ddx1 [Anthonomus grandis grandis]|uniref:ATP-dependent RNA helicase Ddx1 n=1 Tax=Anthonomus grandis grandis TaxID=2921223 RepID=UPI00216697CD|nr:ATP-dependent RNA helicase Ddx1 [Anthonomus grandis grandis]
MAAFEEFGVLPELSKAIDELEWTLPTDIQAESIPLILGGGDILMAAETGSGKTAAFCLPIIQIVWETLKDIQSGKALKSASKVSPPWTMSTHDRGAALAVAPDGLRVQSREQKEWHGVRCTRGISSGKWGFEALVTDEGLCRVGWSTLKASLDLGTDRFGWGFGGTGKKSHNKQFTDYGEAFGKNDVITCLVDFDKGEIKFMKNGVDFGVAFTNVNPKEPIFPAVVLKNAEMAFNFGEKPFKHSLPDKFLPLISAAKDTVAMNTNAQGCSSGEGVVKISNNAPQAVIIEPSRELAEQTSNQIKLFKKYLENPAIRELLVIGGINIKEQISVLQNQGADIIVGTPGRLEDLIQGGYLSLSNCRFFVLDEADGLLKQGYTDLIERLHRQMPKVTADGKRLQMIVCSATLHAFEVKKLAEKLMHFPTWVDLKGEDAVPETVHHVVVNVDPQNDRTWQNLKRHILTDGVHQQDNVRPGNNSPETLSEAVKILKGEYVIRAIDVHEMDRAIIFCRTKLDCDNLEKYMKQIDRRHYSCVCLHGDRKPNERKSNLDTFKRNEVKFLICTDVAARGIDITGLPFMINVTLPDEKSNYVHRIGRVGRAERMGLAISLVSTVPEKVWYHGEWCKSRGKNCWNTNLTTQGGCCIWYNEPQYLADIEEHLNVTIQQIDADLKVPHDEFDGKVVYGQKRQNSGSSYQNHTSQMAPIVKDLTQLESQAQILYLKRHLTKMARVA